MKRPLITVTIGQKNKDAMVSTPSIQTFVLEDDAPLIMKPEVLANADSLMISIAQSVPKDEL